MRKILVCLLTGLAYFGFIAPAYADENVSVSPPPGVGVNPQTPLNTLIGQLLQIIFIIGGLALVAMLLWGGFQWITAGGDKDKVGAAQKKITQSIIGFLVLALALLIAKVIGGLVHIDIFSPNASIPSLGI